MPVLWMPGACGTILRDTWAKARITMDALIEIPGDRTAARFAYATGALFNWSRR